MVFKTEQQEKIRESVKVGNGFAKDLYVEREQEVIGFGELISRLDDLDHIGYICRNTANLQCGSCCSERRVSNGYGAISKFY